MAETIRDKMRKAKEAGWTYDEFGGAFKEKYGRDLGEYAEYLPCLSLFVPTSV